jgi:uncharacterized glyoxalase superfamily protein PhnB
MMANRSAPAATVVPVLVYADAGRALDWLCGAFGFSERLRAAGPDGAVLHAQLAIGDGAVMIGRQGAEFRAPAPDGVSQYALVRVEDVDRHHDQAMRHGARVLKAPADTPFGERQYTTLDLEGHRWTFSQSVADVAPERWGARVPSRA